MKKIIISIPVILLFLAFSCKKDSQSPTSADQNKSEPVLYALGDTSGYTAHSSGFAVYRKEPSPIKRVSPQSPEYAKINNIEGNVFISLCITKVGTVRGAVVKKTDNEIFNRPSLEAAMQWEFTPAMVTDSLPMEVWYSVPFRFRNN
jgi:TonB family protein